MQLKVSKNIGTAIIAAEISLRSEPMEPNAVIMINTPVSFSSVSAINQWLNFLLLSLVRACSKPPKVAKVKSFDRTCGTGTLVRGVSRIYVQNRRYFRRYAPGDKR
ncbi:hypothetical protein BDV36DRAFT_273008 [Aspergillus pseudocaelatus]|uniref:Uncharacterized protein n=1 Tax=Aspergillus pseudocaelatus TaxID=1825620 RepID=A0ABQ6W447_9EURO|nr:hypothetical protein BDV36DRAFT_273008 [Aspergillus pseudocaelatus]